MNRKALPIFAVVLTALSLPTAAFCQETQDQDQTAQAASSPTKYDNTARRTESNKELKETAMVPIRALSSATSLVIGTPVLLARHEAKNLGRYTNALSEEFNSNDGPTPLMILSVPGQTIRTVSTIGEGIADAVVNTRSSWKQPFSKEAFGLGDLNFAN